MTDLTKDNFAEYLAQIQSAQHKEQLPTLRLQLKRPKMTFRFAWILFFVIFYLNFLYQLWLNVGLSLFKLEYLMFNLYTVLFIAAFIFFDIKTYRIKAFWDKQRDDYYCVLSPTHFYWQLNEQQQEIAWGAVIEITHKSWSQQYQSHVLLSLNNLQEIKLYSSHLPLHHRDVFTLLKVYYQKARLFNSKPITELFK